MFYEKINIQRKKHDKSQNLYHIPYQHKTPIHVSACGPKIVKVRGNPNEKYKGGTKGEIKGDDSVCVKKAHATAHIRGAKTLYTCIIPSIYK